MGHGRGLVFALGFALAALGVACGGRSEGADRGATGGMGGSSTADAGDVPVVPDDTGKIGDPASAAARIGLRGTWFAYGDQYGDRATDAKCIKIGLHQPSECAQITTPLPPPALGFPNVNGMLHTAGVAESILPCPDGLETSGCPLFDYEDMWGAGIGFNFNDTSPSPGGAGVLRMWDPAAVGVTGIAFTIENVPFGVLRVEFPMMLTDAEAAAANPPLLLAASTDDLAAGAPYWGAQKYGDRAYPGSPVIEGENHFGWSEIESPDVNAYSFDPSRMIGIRFHVSTSIGSATTYDFTISNVTFLRQ